MLVLIGPSASGKTEIAKILISFYKMEKLITYTTRRARCGEVPDVDYHFVSADCFKTMEQSGEFIETTLYNGNYYGSRKQDAAVNKVVVLDPNGLNRYYKILGEKIISVFLETPAEVRKARMRQRGDSASDIKKRIASDNIVFRKSNILKIHRIIENNNDISLGCLADYIYNYYFKQCSKI